MKEYLFRTGLNRPIGVQLLDKLRIDHIRRADVEAWRAMWQPGALQRR